MGAAKIYYYPRGALSFKTITLTRLSDLQIEPHRVIRDAQSLSGFTLRSDLGSWRGVRIISERITDDSLVRELRTLQSHLRAGGRCSFVRDSDKAIAWSGSSSQAAGNLSVAVTSGVNAFPFNASAALVSGDQITIEDLNPDHRLELVRFSSISGSRIVISDALTFGYTNQTIIRYEDFYPVLRMGEDQSSNGSPMISEYRRSWTLDLSLEESPGEVNAVTAVADGLAGPLKGTDGGGFTIDQVVNFDRIDLLAGRDLSINQWNLYGMG